MLDRRRLLLTVLGGGDNITLPQNLTINAGTLAESFESHLSWVPTSSPAGGTLETDATNYKFGSAGLKLTTPDGAASSIQGTRSDYSFTTDGNISMWVYAHDTQLPSLARINFANNADGTNRYFANFANQIINRPGWNIITCRTSDWIVANGTPSFSNPIQQIRVFFATPNTPHAYTVDGLYIGATRQPAVLFTFDDGVVSQYSEAYAYLKTRKARATYYIVPSWIGGGGYMTWANLQEMYSAGNCIANHTREGTSLSGLDQATMEAHISGGNDDLETNGITTRHKHFAYPGGFYDATALAAVTAQNMLTARTIIAATVPIMQNGLPDSRVVVGRSLNATVSLATAKGYIDTAISRQEIAVLYTHLLEASATGSNWGISDFQALVSYCITNRLPILTMHDLYLLQSGPITIKRAA